MSERDPLWLYAGLWELKESIEEADRDGDEAKAQTLRDEYRLLAATMNGANVGTRLSEAEDDAGVSISADPMFLIRSLMMGPESAQEIPVWERALEQAKATVGRRMVLVLCGEARCSNTVGEVVKTETGPMFRSWLRSDVLGAIKPQTMRLPHQRIENATLLLGVPRDQLVASLVAHCDDDGRRVVDLDALIAKVAQCERAGGTLTKLATRRAVR